jgi:hypothetical protein
MFELKFKDDASETVGITEVRVTGGQPTPVELPVQRR